MEGQGLGERQARPGPQIRRGAEANLGDVEPSLAGPKRPQDRIALKDSKEAFHQLIIERQLRRDNTIASTTERYFAYDGGAAVGTVSPAELGAVPVKYQGEEFILRHGSVVIAAINSCTNTSNPAVLMAAGLVAKKARERGLK